MYTQLFSQLSLANSGPVTQVSQAVAMRNNNAAQANYVIFALTGTGVTFQLEGSNDLENWTELGSPDGSTAIGAGLLGVVAGIGAAFVRLRATVEGSGRAIVSAGINTSFQSQP